MNIFVTIFAWGKQIPILFYLWFQDFQIQNIHLKKKTNFVHVLWISYSIH